MTFPADAERTMTLFDEWKTYERDVVPKDAGQVQREECRRAFYAGAASCLSIIYKATDVPDDGSAAESVLLALDKELAAMPKDLRI